MKYRFALACAAIMALSVTLVLRLDRPPTRSRPGIPSIAPEGARENGRGKPSPSVTLEQLPAAPGAGARRPWAEPIEKPGLPNFHRVTDALYRGAQPTEEGVRELKTMGIRTIVNLRSFHSDRDEIGPSGIAYEHIYMKAWHGEEEDILRFLQIVTDKTRQPVFVHCQHGADRTGTMIAAYRVVVQGWSKEEALREMTEGPYGFHGVWQNLVEFLRGLDVEKVREKAGVPPPGAAGP